MGMIKNAKIIYWEVQKKEGRFEYLNALLSVIPGQLGMILRSLFIPRHFASAGENLEICMGTRFRSIHKIRVGKNVIFGIDNDLQGAGGLTIGDNTITGPGVKIWTANHRYESIEIPIIKQGHVFEPVVIEGDVWIGANVFIMPGVFIPKGCIIAACSVVGKKKYGPYSIIAGHPARIIGYRTQL